MENEDDCESAKKKQEEENDWRKKLALLEKQVVSLSQANKLLVRQVRRKDKQIDRLKENCDQGALVAFAVFPEELWVTILKYINAPEDQLNLSRTSNQLDSLVHPSKSSWMFKLVIPQVFRFLTREDVFACRLTSKKWCSAVDDFVENHPSRHPFSPTNIFPDENILKTIKLQNSGVFHLWDVDRLRHLLVEMRGHPRNPFIGRSVVFNVEIDNDFDDDDDILEDPGISEYWDLSTMFLSLLGQHLWYVELTEDSGHQKPLEFYKLLRKLLIHLPNLKSFKLAVDISHEDYHPKALPLFMAHNPLPALPFLRSLDVECFYSETPQIIHDTLMSIYSSHLRKLHLNFQRWRDIYSRGLVNLTELFIKSFAVEKLNFLRTPNLQKLTIDLTDSTYSTSALLHTITSFKSLQFLKIVTDISVEIQTAILDSRKNLCLPDLRYLEITGMQRKVCYSFLLCFPSLKSVSIKECTTSCRLSTLNPHQNVDEIVKVHKYLYNGEMFKSNVWELLPSLEKFSYEQFAFASLTVKHNCTRENYRLYQTGG